MRPRGPLIAGLACICAPSLYAAPPIVGAHRGLSAGMPENTLGAFRQSVAQSVAVIELDLRMTKDGHLIILHDPTLGRTTECDGAVAQQTLARVRSCHAGGAAHPAEKVPTLSEVLALTRESPTHLLLDCKAAPIDAVIREVRHHQAENRVIIGLRSPQEIAMARRQMPSARLLAFMPRQDDALRFIDAGADIIRLWSDWVEADSNLVARTRKLGKPVWILVGRKLPRTESAWRALHNRMIASGPDGLITNRPELIQRHK